MEEKKDKKVLWSKIENIKGDKIVWMIVIFLILFSIVSIFASTSLLAIEQGTTRLDIFKEQLFIVGLGIAAIFICYFIPSIGFFRVLSQLGFVLSIGLLFCLVAGIGTVEFNDAVRALRIGGLQLHVYEVVKVAMIMYLSWAMQAYHKNEFRIANYLALKFEWCGWMASRTAKRFIYIFIPMLLVCGCVAMGSLSSAVFIGFIMLVTVLIGGIRFRDLILPAVIAIIGAVALIGLHSAAPDKILPRMNTWANRINPPDYKKIIMEYPPSSKEWRDAMDKIRQPEGALVAIKEGGLLGKGPGKSTQKYVVAVMFGDYMFSFILEEYGLLGGIFVIILYVSLLARGSLIVRNCENLFAKTAVAGLILLISGQAMWHMYINVGIGPLTGQTLPMISHGSTSFLCFSIAFGIILSISKLTKERLDSMEEEADPIIKPIEENVQDTLNELDIFESSDLS